MLSNDLTLVQILKARNNVSQVIFSPGFLFLFPFSFWQNFAQIFFLWSSFCGCWAGRCVTGGFLWDVATDSCLLLEMDFWHRGGVWNGCWHVGINPVCHIHWSVAESWVFPSSSGCPLVIQIQAEFFLCYSGHVIPKLTPLEMPHVLLQGFHPGSKEKGERIHSPLKCEGFVPCHWLLSDGDQRGFVSHHTSL